MTYSPFESNRLLWFSIWCLNSIFAATLSSGFTGFSVYPLNNIIGKFIPAARAGRIAVHGEKQVGLPFAGFPPDGFESSVVFRPI